MSARLIKVSVMLILQQKYQSLLKRLVKQIIGFAFFIEQIILRIVSSKALSQIVKN